MSRRPAHLVAVALAIAVFGVTTPANAAKPSLGCPPPFSGPYTLQQLIELAPTVPEEIIEAGFTFYNHNGDDKVCIADLPDTPGIPSVAVNMIDNNASTP